MAEAPKDNDDLPDFFDPDNPGDAESILDTLGIDNIDLQNGSDVNLDLLKEVVSEATNGLLDLNEVKTAEEVVKQEQQKRDDAVAAVVYAKPKEMVVTSVPSSFQVSQTKFFEPIVVRMLDTDDVLMENIGHVSNPAKVRIRISDGELGNLYGQTTSTFIPADGRAKFSGIFVNATDKFVKLTIDILGDDYANISSVTTTEIEIMERQISGDTCEVDEGLIYDLDEMWGDNCTRLCTLPCQKFDGLIEIAPSCSERAEDTCGIHSECQNTGCECGLDSMKEPYHLADEDFNGVAYKCTNESMAVYLDKCVLNRFGYKLTDLAIIGYDTSGVLQSSITNTCLGKVNYAHGTSYLFEIIGFEDCGTDISSNGTHTTYKSKIMGWKETTVEPIENISVDEFVEIDFECSVKK